jgi:hypothetical protein
MTFLAMTHHRLGHRNQARAALAALRTLGSHPNPGGMYPNQRWSEYNYYGDLLREAEAFIEGRPQPRK